MSSALPVAGRRPQPAARCKLVSFTGRSMTFASISGHEQQKILLRQALARRRIAHAYLFAGPRGVGKRLLAMAFIRALLCTRGDGCGSCASCHKIDHGHHPDCHLLEAGDSALKIEQVRQLQKELALRPLEGAYKICLIDGVEQFTSAAANALLKTLEEPRPNTVMILLTSHPEQVLPTIRSRCQLLPFARLPRELLAGILSEQLSLDATSAAVLAALAQGSLDRALGEQRQFYLEKRPELIQALSALSAGSNIPTFQLAEELAADKDNLLAVLDIFETFYRDLLLLCQGCPEQQLVNLDLRQRLESLSRTTGTERLLRQLHILETARHHLQRNVNRQLAIEAMLLQLAAA